MAIARVSFYKRWKQEGFTGKLVSTVHDSIVTDVPDHEVERNTALFHEVFADLSKNFYKVFKVKIPLNFRCEVKIGKNMSDMS